MYKRAALGVALSCAIGHAVASTIVPVEFVFDTASNCNELSYGVSICGMSDTEYYTNRTSTCYFNWSTFTFKCTDALTRAQINENFATEFTKNLNNLLGDRGIDVKLVGSTYGNIAKAVAANGVYPYTPTYPLSISIDALESAYNNQKFGFERVKPEVVKDGASVIIYVMGEDGVYTNGQCVATKGAFIGMKQGCTATQMVGDAIEALYGATPPPKASVDVFAPLRFFMFR